MIVLIVEDEYYNRIALVKMVKDELDQTDTVFEASNGIEALELIRENNVDILFTDIRMPQMDGLELIEKLSNDKRDLLVIVVSGYAEFEYAQKSLRFGVKDYLLKPIKRQKVREKLLEFKQKIEEKERKSKEEIAIKGELSDARLTVLNQQITNLILYGDSSTLVEINEFMGITKVISYCLVALRFFSGAYPIEDDRISQDFMKNVFLMPIKNIPAFEIENYLMYIVVDHQGDEHLNIITLPECLKKLKDTYGKSIVSIGISSMSRDLTHMNSYYEESLRNSLYFYFEKSEHVFEPRKNQELTLEMKEWLNAVKYRIYLQNANQAFKALEPFFDKVKREKNVGLLLAFDSLIKSISEDKRFILSKSQQEIDKDIPVFTSIRSGKYADLDGYFLNVTNYIVSTCYRKDKSSTTQSQNIVDTAKHYVEDHYHDTISQEALSRDVLFVNASYFSRIFKEYEDMPFSVYVKTYRLEKAKHLLKKFDYSVSQIAGMVGFNDVSYFVSSYKKYFGITPGELRNRMSER